VKTEWLSFLRKTDKWPMVLETLARSPLGKDPEILQAIRSRATQSWFGKADLLASLAAAYGSGSPELDQLFRETFGAASPSLQRDVLAQLDGYVDFGFVQARQNAPKMLAVLDRLDPPLYPQLIQIVLRNVRYSGDASRAWNLIRRGSEIDWPMLFFAIDRSSLGEDPEILQAIQDRIGKSWLQTRTRLLHSLASAAELRQPGLKRVLIESFSASGRWAQAACVDQLERDGNTDLERWLLLLDAASPSIRSRILSQTLKLAYQERDPEAWTGIVSRLSAMPAGSLTAALNRLFFPSNAVKSLRGYLSENQPKSPLLTELNSRRFDDCPSLWGSI
jgi:hypothetical protein